MYEKHEYKKNLLIHKKIPGPQKEEMTMKKLLSIFIINFFSSVKLLNVFRLCKRNYS